ncbi:MAG: pyridoxamine 5'-phosphate oxidase family protein [Reichenbachiella sp.]|uniref:pyridoxamine 5'-phosphate oxidase family protein n=1 Tax=Reichenbachiella sp. TaxID=2184521 RepID=UPI003266EC26
MRQNFTNYAFTESVKKAQEKYGSRELYSKMDNNGPDQYQLFHRETAHIEQMDGFYLSTVGENGWPYVQFRGGPKGFVKVIDAETIGFVDFRGNRQYISTGNISANNKTAMIFLDYPSRTRLKVWAESEILGPEDHPDLRDQLMLPDYKANIERLMIFHVKAFDWNCPQHITPKFSISEIQTLINSNHEFRQQILGE